MKNKIAVFTSAVAFCVTAFTLTPAQGGPLFGGTRVIDGSRIEPGRGGGKNIEPIVVPSTTGATTGSSAVANRRGADDPANHDAGDDHGRRHRRGR